MKSFFPLLLIISVWTVQSSGSQPPESTPAANPNPTVFTPPINSRLYPPAVENEVQYQQWLADEIARRIAKIETENEATAPSENSSLRIQTANWILSVACEPILTRILLELDTPQDLEQLKTLTTQATGLLTNLKGENEASPHQADVGTLVTFAKTFAILADARTQPPDPNRVEQVTLESGLLLDEDNRDVAESARLWQCLIFNKCDKSQRALDVLPLVLTPVESNSAAFFARMLRCRILAEQGKTTLAQALLLKMEEQCDTWFSDERLQSEARCTLAWLRWRLAQQAQYSLSEIPQSSWKDFVERTEEMIRDEKEPCQLFRLGSAIPDFGSPPQPHREPSASEKKAQPTPPHRVSVTLRDR